MVGAEEMAQQLGEHLALAEGLNVVPSNHTG